MLMMVMIDGPPTPCTLPSGIDLFHRRVFNVLIPPPSSPVADAAETQPVFSWSGFCGNQTTSASAGAASRFPHLCDVSHEGLVDRFDFGWQYLAHSPGPHPSAS